MKNTLYHFNYPTDYNDKRSVLSQFSSESITEYLHKSGYVYKLFKFIFTLRMQVNKNKQKINIWFFIFFMAQ